jgi:hypothetical protein
MATVANSAGRTKQPRIDLTPTGLLMEGGYTQVPSSKAMISVMGDVSCRYHRYVSPMSNVALEEGNNYE